MMRNMRWAVAPVVLALLGPMMARADEPMTLEQLRKDVAPSGRVRNIKLERVTGWQTMHGFKPGRWNWRMRSVRAFFSRSMWLGISATGSGSGCGSRPPRICTSTCWSTMRTTASRCCCRTGRRRCRWSRRDRRRICPHRGFPFLPAAGQGASAAAGLAASAAVGGAGGVVETRGRASTEGRGTERAGAAQVGTHPVDRSGGRATGTDEPLCEHQRGDQGHRRRQAGARRRSRGRETVDTSHQVTYGSANPDARPVLVHDILLNHVE
jgi:hypothetical protein